MCVERPGEGENSEGMYYFVLRGTSWRGCIKPIAKIGKYSRSKKVKLSNLGKMSRLGGKKWENQKKQKCFEFSAALSNTFSSE